MPARKEILEEREGGGIGARRGIEVVRGSAREAIVEQRDFVKDREMAGVEAAGVAKEKERSEDEAEEGDFGGLGGKEAGGAERRAGARGDGVAGGHGELLMSNH